MHEQVMEPDFAKQAFNYIYIYICIYDAKSGFSVSEQFDDQSSKVLRPCNVLSSKSSVLGSSVLGHIFIYCYMDIYIYIHIYI